MIDYKKTTLSNGLRVLVHEDATTPMAVMNILYDVGARDEDPEKTGFAHLFEHLMFGGSVNIPSYDAPLQRVGGENNAFTSNDITNYYITLPANNLETAFWLESDRMLSLAFSEQSLDVQRNVVCEEFKQRYLNQPYGDVWLHLRPLAYTTHPYRWATIGKELAHIEQATLNDVKAFFFKHYCPKNAIMVIAGAVNYDEVIALSEKWFGPIPAGEKYVRNLPKEPKQTAARRKEMKAKVPMDAIYKCYHVCSRTDQAYYATDMLTDILSRGYSSRLYQRLLKEQGLFSDIHAYMTGDIDNGLIVVEGKLSKGVSREQAETAIDLELEGMKNEPVPAEELEKVKNKIESTMIFAEMNLLNKAMNLAYFELLGDASLANAELDKYLAVTAADIQKTALEVFQEQNCSTLFYEAEV